MDLKILIIQEAGRHEKNFNFRESLNLHRAFKTYQNINTEVWGLNYSNFNEDFTKFENWCDVILILENYTSSWFPVDTIKSSKKLKIFWSIDSHCVPNQHQNLVKDLGVDVVLHSVYGHEKLFPNTKNFWFPNAYPDDLISPIENIDKIYDIGFCGNINNRHSYLNLIEQNFKLKKDIFVIGDDMVKSINQYKIHFNRNISDDINYRTFETLGCKTFLITNETSGLKHLFDIGNNIITYTDKNFLDVIRYYLNNDDEREKITELGYNHVKNNHTYVQRAKKLIEIIQSCL